MAVVIWITIIADIVVFFFRVNHHVPGWNAQVRGGGVVRL